MERSGQEGTRPFGGEPVALSSGGAGRDGGGVQDERSWRWDAGEDPHIGNVEKTITLRANGLSYTGWGDEPIIGGGYSIGFQPVAEFLQRGPLAEQEVPAGIVEEIRAYVVEHSRSEAACQRVAGATAGAARLLAYWAPVDRVTGLPAVRVAVTLHLAPAPIERIWTTTPTAKEVAEYGGYPQTFAGPQAGELRYPVGVETLNVATPAAPGEPRHGTRAARDVALRVRQLLATAVMAGGPQLDQRTEQLIDHVADELTRDGDDLLLVAVAAEPGSRPIDDELHVLRRDALGRTLRLMVAPATRLPQVAGSPTGWGDTPTGGHDCEPDLLARVASLTLVLNDLFWMGERARWRGNRVPFTARVEPHGLDLDHAVADTADHEIRAWWRKAGLRGGLPGRGPGRGLTRLDADSLARVLANLDEMYLSETRGRNRYSPGRQRDHLVTGLGRDLVDTVAACVTSGGDIPPMAAYAIGLPVPKSVPDYGFHACLLLVGARLAGLIAIDTAV